MAINRTTTFAGIFGAAGAALWTLFEFAMGWHGPRLEIGAMTGFIGVLFPLAALIWALRRNKVELGGRLSLAQAMLCGLSVSLINAAIGIIFFYFYFTVINPGFMIAMASRGQPVELSSQLASVAIGSLAFGLVVSLSAGLIMRRGGGMTAKDEA